MSTKPSKSIFPRTFGAKFRGYLFVKTAHPSLLLKKDISHFNDVYKAIKEHFPRTFGAKFRGYLFVKTAHPYFFWKNDYHFTGGFRAMFSKNFYLVWHYKGEGVSVC